MQTIIARRSERGGLSEVCRRRGSCRSSRRGRAVLSSTTACTSPRTRWRSSRARCRSGPSFLASFEARVCVSASACLLCVSASAWLSGQGSSLCVSCVVSCVRCELLAVRAQEPWRVCRLGDVTYTRFAQLGLRLRGSVRFEVRGRRVCLWLRPLYCLSLAILSFSMRVY